MIRILDMKQTYLGRREMQSLKMSKEYRWSIREIEEQIHTAAGYKNSGKLLKVEEDLKRLQKLIDGRAAQMSES